MNATWATVVGLCGATALIKAAGPVMFGGRDLPAAVLRMITLLAPALLAALVVVETLTGAEGDLSVGATAAGVAAAGGVLALRRNATLAAIAAAAITAAAIRALS